MKFFASNPKFIEGILGILGITSRLLVTVETRSGLGANLTIPEEAGAAGLSETTGGTEEAPVPEELLRDTGVGGGGMREKT